MKRNTTAIMLGAALFAAAMPAALCAAPNADGHLLQVTSIDIARQGAKGQRLAVALTIDLRSVDPGRDREVVFTPQIISANGADTVSLAPIRVAGRNRYFSHIRNNDLTDDTRLYEAGSKTPIEYRAETDFLPWMEKSRVEMAERIGHCCDPILPAGETPLAEIDYSLPAFEPTFQFVDLTGDEQIERQAEGRAFVDFIVNRTEIREGYRRNRFELAKILNSIQLVKDDPDAIITAITIKGFASPEGPYLNNVRLAMGRTQALKEYVRERLNFAPEIMHTDYEPEDWEGLINSLDTIDIPNKAEIVAIAKSDLEPDPRNSEIQKRFPREYKFILDSIYPALRHSDYTVKYNIKTYVDINELKRVFRQDPTKLRPIDFQRIAATYPVESPEYEEVYLKASEVYPTDPEAALNAANIYLKHGDKAKAAERLQRAGDGPQANFTRATLAAMNGDWDRARSLFMVAAEAGFEPAAAERDRVDDLLERTSVTYLITPVPAKK
ncbi:MAG: DUF3868 domain-containing protein [Muribaculaceae bacterium]|nr:DUF3868 domain-containing protein [Muribaculaceae bacterium]